MILKEGIYQDIPADVYHSDPLQDPGFSSGLAVKIMKNSLTHARSSHPKFGGKSIKQSPAMQFGSLCHAILEGAQNISVIDADNFRTKAAREKKEEAEQNGYIPCLSHEHRKAHTVIEQLLDQTDAFDHGNNEVSYVWKDADVWCRARADNLDENTLYINDYKTTQGSSNPYHWMRNQLWPEMKYLQAALYTRGMEMLTGNKYRFRFIVQEVKEEPFAVSIIELDATSMAYAQDMLDTAIQKWANALKTGDFYGYPTVQASLPKYLEAEWEAINYGI